ncbi:MAG: class I SAM-dependent methyltransferase [Jiangellaceae bacterium]
MALPLTGERTVPGRAEENYWFRRHEAAYRAVMPLCVGARVLEAGCGEGYGAAALLDSGASTVVALDYDAAAIDHASRTYDRRPTTVIEGRLLGSQPNETVLDHGDEGSLALILANLVALPFTEGTFDVVVSLQTVEHLWDQQRFVAECARVLPPGGRLVLSTPNRFTFPAGNPFHTRELDATEMLALVQGGPFRVETLLGLQHGDRIAAYERRHGDLVAGQLATELTDWSAHLAAHVAATRADDFVLSPDDIDTCLDLLVIATRP